MGAQHQRCADSAFTMVEIALCLAIIAFALVAIIGVLPTGLKVQKENREDTVINQDGTFLIEAIRSGSRGIDYLTNFFDSITVSNRNQVRIYTNSPGLNSPPLDGSLTNGLRIVSLLTYPKYYYPSPTEVLSNRVSGYIRSLSGSALTRSQLTRDFAFAYQFTSEVVPLSTYPGVLTNFTAPGLPPGEVATRSNLWALERNQSGNFNELRLTLQGPVLRRGREYQVLGTPKTFRAILSGTVSNVTSGGGPGSGVNWLVQPSTFVQVR